ncbi:hypothetical protein ACQWU4_14645 [Chryseobacterium sp. MIQD13]|uniref:hypothetical protein n=1 Tax=Chryseobacterium sp. MIQD13 TaxID=3422310 RepID=UPI003D268F06
MRTQFENSLKKLSRKDQQKIIAGHTSLSNGGSEIDIDEGNGGGGTNNGGGSGNVVNPCLVKINKCLSYNRCIQQDVPLC